MPVPPKVKLNSVLVCIFMASAMLHHEDRSELAAVGSAVRSDRRSASLTAPNALDGAKELVAAAMVDGDTALDTLAWLERNAHGSGDFARVSGWVTVVREGVLGAVLEYE